MRIKDCDCRICEAFKKPIGLWQYLALSGVIFAAAFLISWFK